ncbi:acyloxyacyl hydrolase [Winogradskyella sp. SYSU M77433]|uniref:acyloxyacyl hydrolase n=1 Tax=Winogradskyella sp. SYSU M77433 TaxID=3042722 RepID=UPI002480045E|nr:acyloxyacyl hydrolase [Winogradskyella sp. SYSU M77433]MDH7914476.1 acyloxyacyl hydrolase [Winogradskyella sp. SYSU M77433]
MQIKNHCKLLLTFFFGLFYQISTAQNKDNSIFIIPEIVVGKTLEANTFFPETKLQKDLFLSLGKYNFDKNKEWAARLNYPKTGITLGYTDFGNSEKVGHAYTLMPFIEFSILKKTVEGLNLQVGIGGSYMDTQYDATTNPFNKAITTKINWSFRSFLYYNVFKSETLSWRFGLGYLHHSNGHTSLPNQGLNSLAASISTKIDTKKQHLDFEKPKFSSKSQSYFSTRIGIGQNVLSEKFNTKKEVFTYAASAGKIINNTFKFGGGFYYRFYEHYYDYINNNEVLVEEDYPHFRDNAYGYATNFGLFATAELLMSHIGFEFELGLNVYKPFYKIDWRLNQGYDYENANGETIEVLGELDWYYEIKRTVSARMGLKYYLWSTNTAPKHNIFIGAHINANLGQADFTELSLGYVYRFNSKEKS